MDKNIILNKSLRAYNKKYKKHKHKLIVLTKDEIRRYDILHEHYRVDKKTGEKIYYNYLLKDRKWWYIDGRYYEAPDHPAITGLKIANVGGQALFMAMPYLVVIGGITAACIVGLRGSKVYKDADALYVDDLNKVVSDNNNIKTTFDAVDYFKKNKNINLEETTAKIENHEYAFDIDNREFLVLNKDGSVAYTPKPIVSKSSVFRFEENYTYESTVENPSNVYGTYLTEKIINNASNKTVALTNTINTEETKDELIFYTSLDVGYNKQYTLKFEPKSDFKPIIVTNRNDLDINGAASDVTHFGVASALTVTKLEGTYNEKGSVDGEVHLKSKVTFNVAPESAVNTIIVDNDEVKINAQKDSYVGTLAKTENVTKTLEEIASGSDQSAIVEETDVPIPLDPESRDFDGGFGTYNSPFCIETAESLNELSADVNDETKHDLYANKYYRITKDIDLIGTSNFTPIGTSSKPFKGYVDGNNTTISNLTISVVEESSDSKSNIALFGYTEGTANTSYKNMEDVYKDGKFYEDNIAENKYTCVIKNLKIEHANVSVDTNVAKKYKHKQTAAFIGLAHNTRVDNLHLISGNIHGNKASGGVVGSSEDSVVLNCSTSEDVTVKGDEYNNGGVVGCMSYTSGLQENGNGVFNCTNEATVINLNKNSNGGGYGGGVVGFASGSGQPKDTSFEGPHRGNHIIGCTNNGLVSTNDEDTTKKCEHLGGIVGYGGAAIELVANCTNNGTIINKSNTKLTGDYGGGMGGIASFTSGIFINCINTGLLDGKCDFKAGLISQRSNNGHFPFKIIGGVNTGTLTTEDVTYCSKIVSGVQAETEISNLTFEDTDDFANSIGFRLYGKPESSYSAVFKNITVNNPNGNYVIRNDIQYLSITSDRKLFDTFTMHSNLKGLTIDAPMGNVTLSNAPSCNLTIVSDNTQVTIPSGVKINNLYVGGNNASIINNGDVNCVTLMGKANKLVNNSTGVINCGVVIGGVKNFTKETEITNYGTIKKNATDQGTHLISVNVNSDETMINNITLNNYGIIKYTSVEPNYWLLMYSKGHFEYNGYAGSEMNLVNNVSPLAKYDSASVTYNHQVAKGQKAAALYTKDGSTLDWNTLKGTNVEVIEIQ